MRIPLAVAGESPLAHVDECGYLHFAGGWRLEWWVGGDDHWHVPAASPSRRQRVLDNTPVVETVIRVPGGDVAWRAGAAASAEGGSIVIEFHNGASVPVAIGIAMIAPDAPTATRPAIHFTSPARAVAADLGVELLVHPVSHTTTWRCSVGPNGPDALPPIDAIVRGWQTLARQGASIATGDPTLDDALALARTSLLLHAGTQDRAQGAAVATALTLMGHEDQAESMRLRLRLRPKRRGLPVVAELEPALNTDPFTLVEDPIAAARTVAAVRAQLVADTERRLLSVLPSERDWRGRTVDIRDLPTNRGQLSFALRWHGDKPALLWERSPKPRASLRAPVLDPAWSSNEPVGEELLGVTTAR